MSDSSQKSTEAGMAVFRAAANFKRLKARASMKSTRAKIEVTNKTSSGLDSARVKARAYEYLCHLEEAKRWIESFIEEKLPPVNEFEKRLCNGVMLAKVGVAVAPTLVQARSIFDPKEKIFDSKGLQFRHTDNISKFLQAVKHVNVPEHYLPEVTDVYANKNIPRLIFCLHALSIFLNKLGVAPSIESLHGVVDFSEDELVEAEKRIESSGADLAKLKALSDERRASVPEPVLEEEDEAGEELDVPERQRSELPYYIHWPFRPEAGSLWVDETESDIDSISSEQDQSGQAADGELVSDGEATEVQRASGKTAGNLSAANANAVDWMNRTKSKLQLDLEMDDVVESAKEAIQRRERAHNFVVDVLALQFPSIVASLEAPEQTDISFSAEEPTSPATPQPTSSHPTSPSQHADEGPAFTFPSEDFEVTEQPPEWMWDRMWWGNHLPYRVYWPFSVDDRQYTESEARKLLAKHRNRVTAYRQLADVTFDIIRKRREALMEIVNKEKELTRVRERGSISQRRGSISSGISVSESSSSSEPASMADALASWPSLFNKLTRDVGGSSDDEIELADQQAAAWESEGKAALERISPFPLSAEEDAAKLDEKEPTHEWDKDRYILMEDRQDMIWDDMFWGVQMNDCDPPCLYDLVAPLPPAEAEQLLPSSPRTRAGSFGARRADSDAMARIAAIMANKKEPSSKVLRPTRSVLEFFSPQTPRRSSVQKMAQLSRSWSDLSSLAGPSSPGSSPLASPARRRHGPSGLSPKGGRRRSKDDMDVSGLENSQRLTINRLRRDSEPTKAQVNRAPLSKPAHSETTTEQTDHLASGDSRETFAEAELDGQAGPVDDDALDANTSTSDDGHGRHAQAGTESSDEANSALDADIEQEHASIDEEDAGATEPEKNDSLGDSIQQTNERDGDVTAPQHAAVEQETTEMGQHDAEGEEENEDDSVQDSELNENEDAHELVPYATASELQQQEEPETIAASSDGESSGDPDESDEDGDAEILNVLAGDDLSAPPSRRASLAAADMPPKELGAAVESLPEDEAGTAAEERHDDAEQPDVCEEESEHAKSRRNTNPFLNEEDILAADGTLLVDPEKIWL